MPLVDSYFATARERYRINQSRLKGHLPPWTDDPIFRAWRFCNVHREHDRTTIWFKENVRDRVSGVQAVIATVGFRWFNLIETGERILPQLLGEWDSQAVRDALVGQSKVITGAYMVRTEGGMSKVNGILWYMDQAVPRIREMAPSWGNSLQEAWRDLCSLVGMGKFTSYEVVTDLRHTPVLNQATDIMSWASAGPGCARGLGWTFHEDPFRFNYTSERDQAEMRELMLELLTKSRYAKYWVQRWDHWEMREVEHWACEFDKYCRARNGFRLKRRFTLGQG